jgi:hypothetical protein
MKDALDFAARVHAAVPTGDLEDIHEGSREEHERYMSEKSDTDHVPPL